MQEEHAKALLDLRCAEKELELLAHTYEEREQAHGAGAGTRTGTTRAWHAIQNFKPQTLCL
jgi:hypothetical protein